MTLNLGVCQSELPWGDAFSVTATDVTRICEEVAALGATSIRISALWQQIEPTRNYKYKVGAGTDLDRAITAAEDNGLDILLIVEPRRVSWLQMFGIPMGISASAKNATDYGRMCGAIAEEYGDRITYWEIGNEVNNLAFFGSPKDPAKYIQFLRAAYENIKPHAPASTVLAGALMAVGTGWPSLHPVEWVTAFYKSNPQDWFDGLSMHPYSTSGVFDPMAPTADNEFAFKNIEAVRAIMDANGDGPAGRDIKIFCSEWGYDSIRSLNGLSTTDAELEEEQAANLATHWNLLEIYADDGVIFDTTWVYNYRDQKTEDDPAYRFGQVRFDYTKKAGWYFLRSLAGETTFAAPTATISVEGHAPEVEIFVDFSHPKPPAGTITVQGHAPTVIQPIAVPTGTIEVRGWPPAVDTLSEVQWVSTGAGDRDTTVTDDITLSWLHDITTVGRLFVGLVVSHENSKPWELYDTLTVSSDLDGAFTRLASRHIGHTSNREGSLHIFSLEDPTVDEHTITAHVAEADGGVTDFTSVAGNSVLYRGVSAVGATAAAGSSGFGVSTPTVTIASTVDNMVLCVFGAASDITANFTKTIRHDDGSIVDGNGDFILIADAAGAPSVTFNSSSPLTFFGALAIDLQRIT